MRKIDVVHPRLPRNVQGSVTDRHHAFVLARAQAPVRPRVRVARRWPFQPGAISPRPSPPIERGYLAACNSRLDCHACSCAPARDGDGRGSRLDNVLAAAAPLQCAVGFVRQGAWRTNQWWGTHEETPLADDDLSFAGFLACGEDALLIAYSHGPTRLLA